MRCDSAQDRVEYIDENRQGLELDSGRALGGEKAGEGKAHKQCTHALPEVFEFRVLSDWEGERNGREGGGGMFFF